MDPVTLEVINSSLLALSDEMTNNFWRTSYSPMNYEVRDFAVGLVDQEGRIIAQSRITHPAFTGDLGFVVSAAIREIGAEGINDGDVVISNDPVSQGQHLNNVVAFTPLMVDGEPLAYCCIRAHWQDVGGMTIESGATNSTEIFQEGIQFDAVKVFKAHVPNADVLRIIKRNSRFPEMVLGDLNAQVAACKLGIQRLGEIVEKYGRDNVREAIRINWDMSERAARKALRQIRPGEYRAESFLDDDGVDLGKPVPVKVLVKVTQRTMTIDFSEISDQVKGSINSGFFGGATNAARIAFKCLTTPDLPCNEGCFRPLRVVCPPGKILSAQPPAALGDWSVPFPTIIDTILAALSNAVPDRIPAATRGDARGISLAGFEPTRRKFFTVSIPHPGGHGARPNRDGPAPRCAIQQGDEHMMPVEVLELKHPVLFEKLELRQDSGGAGTFRGGLGIEVVASLSTDSLLRNKMIRSQLPPWGVHGGLDGAPNQAYVIDAEGSENRVGRVSDLPIPAGRKVRLQTGGGGGYGNPLLRDPAQVRQDVRNGYISVSAAERQYGVVIHPATSEIDEDATNMLRSGQPSGSKS